MDLTTTPREITSYPRRPLALNESFIILSSPSKLETSLELNSEIEAIDAKNKLLWSYESLYSSQWLVQYLNRINLCYEINGVILSHSLWNKRPLYRYKYIPLT